MQAIPIISDVVLEEVISLATKKQTNRDYLDEELRNEKSRHEFDKIERVNEDGKTVTVQEKDLWTELYHLGLGSDKSDAEAVLRKKYPVIFTLFEKDIELAKKFNEYCYTQLGLYPDQMTLVGIINLVLNLIDYKIKQNK